MKERFLTGHSIREERSTTDVRAKSENRDKQPIETPAQTQPSVLRTIVDQLRAQKLCRIPQYYPIKNYRGLSPNYRGERWAYVDFIGESAKHPVNYLRPTFGLHHKACMCVYLLILISDEPTNKKYEVKMHIEASKTIFLRLFQWGK